MAEGQINTFVMLTDTASALLYASGNSAQQCITAFTESGDIVHALGNPLDHSLDQYDNFFEELIALPHAYLPFILCVWRDGTIDLPSFGLRRV